MKNPHTLIAACGFAALFNNRGETASDGHACLARSSCSNRNNSPIGLLYFRPRTDIVTEDNCPLPNTGLHAVLPDFLGISS